MRAYYSKAGQHVHIALFHDGKLGDICIRDGLEFKALTDAMPGFQFLPLEERNEVIEMAGFKGICVGGPMDGETLQSYKQTYPVVRTRDRDGVYEWSLKERQWNWVGPKGESVDPDEPPPVAA